MSAKKNEIINEITKKKRFISRSFKIVEALQSQQMFDPSTAHLVLNTLRPLHSTSVRFSLFLTVH